MSRPQRLARSLALSFALATVLALPKAQAGNGYAVHEHQ